MSKRPAIDLSALTSEQAMPMAEAAQRSAAPAANLDAQASRGPVKTTSKAVTAVKTADLQGLAFKVPPAFRKRFRQCAAGADLKMNELLFAALDAWEEKAERKKA